MERRAIVAVFLVCAVALAAAQSTAYVASSGYAFELSSRDDEYELAALLSFDLDQGPKHQLSLVQITGYSMVDAETNKTQQIGSERIAFDPVRDSITYFYQYGRFQFGPNTTQVESKPPSWRKNRMVLDAEVRKNDQTMILPSYIRTALKAAVWDAVEDAYLVLIDGFPGVDHYYNYYNFAPSMQDFMHSFGYLRYDSGSDEWNFELIGSDMLNMGIGAFGNQNLGGVNSMAIDYDNDLLYLVGGYSHPEMRVRRRSDPLMEVDRFQVGVFNGTEFRLFRNHSGSTGVYGWSGLAFDYDNSVLRCTISFDSGGSSTSISPFDRPNWTHVGVVDLANEQVTFSGYLQCTARGGCLRGTRRGTDDYINWNNLVLRSVPSTSLASLAAPATHDGSSFTVQFTWDPIPPPNIAVTALAAPITGGTLSSYVRISATEYTVLVTPDSHSSDVVLDIPSTFAAPYAHSSSSATIRALEQTVSYTFTSAAVRVSERDVLQLSGLVEGTATVNVGVLNASEFAIENGVLQAFSLRSGQTYDFTIAPLCDGLVGITHLPTGNAGTISYAPCLLRSLPQL